VLAVRIHLDPSTTDNGSLRVVPGSHQLGRIPSAAAGAAARDCTPVLCTVARGAALLMRPLILHASSKSTVTSPRRVLHFLYAPAHGDGIPDWPQAV